MSQFDFGNLISPLSGADLIDSNLEPWRDALHTTHSGSTRPSYVVAGTLWLDTSSTPWLLKMFQGSDDIILGSLDTTGLDFTPTAAPAPGAGTVSNTMLENAVANTLKGNATGSTAGITDISISDNVLVGRNGGNITGLAIATSGNAFGKLNTANTYSAAQRGAVVSVSFNASTTLDFAAGNNFQIGALTANIILNNPTNQVEGQSGAIHLVQDGTGGKTLTLGNNFMFDVDADKSISTGANSRSSIYYTVRASGIIECSISRGIVA